MLSKIVFSNWATKILFLWFIVFLNILINDLKFILLDLSNI